MRKSVLLILLVAVATILSGIVCLADAPDSSYTMVLNDEFDGSALNTDIWTYRKGNPYGGKNLEENVRISDGKLYLDYRKVDGYYTGGGILTLANLPYGYYETKAKTYTGANGFHTSFWTASGTGAFTQKPERMPQNSAVLEIDGFEFNSNQTDIAPKPAYNFHYWWGDHVSTGGSYYDCDTDGNASTPDWFTMGFEWLPGEIIFYCNGTEVGRISPEVYNPSSLWLTAVAMPEDYMNSDGTYNIDDTKMDENGYFGSSEYEYFRYYNKKLKGVNLLGNGHFELNRHDKINYPRSYYVTGLVNPVATSLANSGFYAVHMFKGSTMGQELPYIAPGKYAFEGYFQTKNAESRLAVYDKDGTLLKSVSIPESNAWTKVSLTDIQVEGSAYAVVEVTEGEILVDDLSFFCQEGLEGYENYRDTDYEKYAAFKSAESTATVIPANTATKSNIDWTSSTVTGMSNLYAHASWTNYSKVTASLESTLQKDEKYEVLIYQIIHKNNVPKQQYTVTLDGETIVSKVAVVTKDNETQSGAWVKLCDIDGKAGQVLKVDLNIPNPGFLASGNARITPVKLLGYDEKFTDTAFIAQFSNPVFQYHAVPYLFDKADTTLSPYKLNDEIYVPYQALKQHFEIPNVDASAKYVTATQINASGTYKLLKKESYIIIYPTLYEPSQNAQTRLVSFFGNFQNSFLHSVDKAAVFKGTADALYQEVHNTTEAIFVQDWGTSSLGYNNSRYSGINSATASWEISPKHTNRYSVEFYSVVHEGNPISGSSPSTTSAGIDLSLLGKTYSFRLDQCNGQQGWYSLGEFNLEAGDAMFIDLYNAAGSGILRASAVRLVPVFEIASFAGTEDKSNQEYYAHTDAVKTGTWTNSESMTQAVYSEENKNALLKWTVSPKENMPYRIQIFSPASGNTATAGSKVSLKVNDALTSFIIDQKTSSAGWYELAMLDLTTDDTVTIELTNLAGENTLYAKGIRLLPALETPVFVNDIDVLNQEYYDHTLAKKIGAWQDSGGDYKGCCTAPNGGNNTDASITWNVSPAKSTEYSVQVYVPKYTTSGAKDATITLDINGSVTQYTVCQRADSAENTGNGWYELGVFSFKPTDKLSVSIENRTELGWLRAKAIRLVPVNEAKYATTQDILINSYYGPEKAEKTGEWLYSSGEYAGCIYAQHTASNKNASIRWAISPDTNNTYDIQVFIPKYTSTATSGAEYTIDINGKIATFVADQRMESADNTGSGWYSLGSYALKTTDSVSVSIKNRAQESFLRAKGVRLIPTNVTPAFVGNFAETNQELHTYSTAVKNGNWRSSSAVTGFTTYYGDNNSTITWTPVPKESQKYSVQVFIPCHTSGSTRDAYVTLTIDGLSHTFSGINQNANPTDGTGWYDFGVYNLTPTSKITVTMGKNTGTYVRAMDMRLVPYPGSASVAKSGSTVFATLGTISNYAKTVVFAEFDAVGKMVSTQILDSKPTLMITMLNEENDYKLFYWKNMHSMTPVLEPYSSK